MMATAYVQKSIYEVADFISWQKAATVIYSLFISSGLDHITGYHRNGPASYLQSVRYSNRLTLFVLATSLYLVICLVFLTSRYSVTSFMGGLIE